MWYNNKCILDKSRKVRKFTRELWVNWMTKLRATVMEILRWTCIEYNQYEKNIISFNI